MLSRIKHFVLTHLIPNRVFLFALPAKPKAIYLTFDDGPVSGVTDRLLDLLAEHDAKATFFLIGKHVERAPELVERLHRDQHGIGNHSYDHPNFNKLSAELQDQQVQRANQCIESITGERIRLFRAPQGRWNRSLVYRLYRQNMVSAHWSRDSMDYKKEPAEKLVKRFQSQPVKSGDIILFHDDDDRCIVALEQLIPFWKSQGFAIKALES